MKLMLYFVCLIAHLTLSSSSIYPNLKDNLLSLFYPQVNTEGRPILIEDVPKGDAKVKNMKAATKQLDKRPQKSYFDKEFPNQGIEDAGNQKQPRKMRIFRANAEVDSPTTPDARKEYYHIDPVLNMMRNYRRYHDSSSDLSTSSSSREMKDWKKEFQEMWLHKKFEALNQSMPGGDSVNMLAARPWGVPCGDPNQHDMPWGTCMLSMECESEYRIYRGDMFCGRTRFVCCAILLTTYDMYEGFDISLDSKSMTTDSEEKKEQTKTSREKRRRKTIKDRKRRRRQRENRKRKIQRSIRRIIKEIKKILNKQYRNGTKERKRRTKQLKSFIKDLKRQYRKDHESVKNLHDRELLTIDQNLQKRLKQIKFMNEDFMSNSTFREIVVNGTISKKGARMLLHAYPELAAMVQDEERKRRERRRTRRGRGDAPTSQEYLEYDIEYGYLYS